MVEWYMLLFWTHRPAGGSSGARCRRTAASSTLHGRGREEEGRGCD